ncbi:MAG: type II toxin-antitoxin system VapC family toxin [Opitutaceae bacterium]|jgi:predicted nucleic acid-binding protein|nr:type II toxin-antitoxin system VapC family toxin [Opitutaceae bacterium]
MSRQTPRRVAVDTNVLIDLARPGETIHDALDLMRRRIAGGVDVWVLPTVLQELLSLSEDRGETGERRMAGKAMDSLRTWGFKPINFMPVGHGIIERIADGILSNGLLPPDERNDSLIVAEAALADCTLLLSSDNHMCGIDANRLRLFLESHDAGTPLIASPAKIVRDFFPLKKRL